MIKKKRMFLLLGYAGFSFPFSMANYMKNERVILSDLSLLRRSAEERYMQTQEQELITSSSPEEVIRLVHELSIHQIELEMQQEELLQANVELEESLKRYSDLYDFAPVGYLTLARDSTIIEANLTATTMLGLERSRLKGVRFIGFLDNGDLPLFTSLMERLFSLRERAGCDLQFHHSGLQQNAELPPLTPVFHIEAVASDDGRECRVVLSDISRQKEMERKRQEWDESVHTLYDAFPEPVFLMNPEGIILSANQAFKARFESSERKILGTNVFTLIPPELAITRRKKVEEVLRTASRLSFEDEWGGRNYLHTINPLIGMNGKVARLLIIALDFTSLNPTEREIMRQKTRYRGMFNNMFTGYAYCRVIFEKGVAVDYFFELVNLNATKISGFEEIEGRRASEIVPDFHQSHPEILEKVGRVALNNQAERFEFYFNEINKWFDVSLYSPQKECVVALFTPMRNIEAGMWEWNLADGTMVWSDEIRKIYNLEEYHGEAHYVRWRQSIVPADREYTEKIIRSAVAKGCSFNIVCHVFRADGHVRRLMNQAFPERDADGVVYRYKGISVDISEYIDEELYNPLTMENLEAFLSVSVSPIAVIALDGRILHANSFFKEHYSKSAGDSTGTSFHELFSSELSRCRQAKFELVFQTGEPIHFKDEFINSVCEADRNKKVLYQLSVYPVYGNNGNIVLLAVFITEISESKKIEESFIAIDKRYQTLIKTSPDSIITTDLQGVITTVSDIALELYGTENSAELTGFPFSNIVYGDDIQKIDEIFSIVLHEGLVQNREILLKKKNKTIYSSEISMALIQNCYGVPESYMIIIRDISQRKIIESELFHAKRLISLGEMVSGIAHEIFQPINNIGLLVDKIVMEAAEGKCLREKSIKTKAQKIFENIERTQTIIDNVRLFSSADKSYVSSVVHLNKCIKNVLLMVSARCKDKLIKLSFTPNPAEATVTGNMYKFEEVLQNVINNAIDALEEKRQKSKIDFSMKISIKSFQENGFVVVTVDDNGIGISPENIEHIMHPFYTTKEMSKGTGLGLSITSRIIKEMRGTLSVASTPMVGTCFTVRLPSKD